MNTYSGLSGRRVGVFRGATDINLGIARGYVAADAKVSIASRKQATVDAAAAPLGDGALDEMTADMHDGQKGAAALTQAASKHGPRNVIVSGAARNLPVQFSRPRPQTFSQVKVQVVAAINRTAEQQPEVFHTSWRGSQSPILAPCRWRAPQKNK